MTIPNTRLPTSNGKIRLVDQLNHILINLRRASVALYSAAPQARDYATTEHYQQAYHEWNTRNVTLETLLCELTDLRHAIREQPNE